ncbi:uncharacterized protein PpBr36_09731 [Pyricularia pennisetigena]|uniref:uncharacterized protein n=1 Tax=Pyricularia pennisetigena TaxID=1578925 RepID=UPI001150692E|nr:uncharacterized protein PpBr36_09731 [Pyricularia pennisetigena]TLS22289.1 hypothetical protein PpBr36_09731 [Pyricularia pennisetigena]
MSLIQGDCKHHMSYVPALEGEENFDEWKRNVIRALTARGLIHVLEGVQADQDISQDKEKCISCPTPESSVDICSMRSFDETNHSEVSQPASFQAASDTKSRRCASVHSHQSHTNSGVDAASDMKAKQERQGSMERSEALLLMSQSLVGVHEWLVLRGFDPCEEDPAQYFQAVQDVFTRLSTWALDDTRRRLREIKKDGYRTVQQYRQELLFLRNRYLRAECPTPRDEREREVLWWTIDSFKAWCPTLHAQLARDMMEAPGSGQMLTWSRLMRQLAYMYEGHRYRYVLGPDATDG